MAAGAQWVGSVFLKSFYSFGFVAVFFNFIFLLYQLYPATWESGTWLISLTGFLLLQFVIIVTAKGFQLSGQPLSVFLEKSLTVLMGCFFSIWAVCLSPDTFIFLKKASIFNYLLGFLLVWFLHRALLNETNKSPVSGRLSFFKSEIFYYFAALILIGFSVIDPGFEVNRYHSAFFLGPLADMRVGANLF